MDVEKLNIKWNKHYPISYFMFCDFLENNLFTDIILIVEGKCIQTHKIILSACSPYFMNLFKTYNDDIKPIVCILEISFEIFELLIKYIYTGEIIVDKQKLTQFINAAEKFQILGISKQPTDIIETEIQKRNFVNTIQISDKKNK